MSENSLSRRSALRGSSYVFGAGVVSLDRPPIARAAHEAHQVAQATAPATYTLLAASDVADIEALTSQIVTHADDVRRVLEPQVRRQSRWLGWKLIGFEDLHVFEPPLGYDDRNGSAT